ncbi:MAG TPA: phosphatase PAP2 family protein, partial [Thermoanaerobaculia bacterium]|nr:phosphatase PAP2 family protein [Thermoanaerobaculia bacterium]
MKPLRHLWTRLERLGVSLLAGFFVCAVLVVAFGFLAREVFSTARTGPLDREITISIRALHAPPLDRAARVITFFGGHLFLIPATLLVALGLRSRGHRISALLFSGSVVGGFGLNSLLKITFHRARPDLWQALVAEHTYSFPSGHAAMSTVFFGGLAAVALHLSKRPVVRVTALVLAAVAAMTIAATRVYLGVHWTTDVVAGMLVGLFWVV